MRPDGADKGEQMKSLWRLINFVSQGTGKTFSLLYVIVVGVVCFEVISRYLFNAPTSWAQEMMQFLCGVAYLIGGAYALQQGAHVKMGALYERFPPRVRALADILTFPIFLIFIVALVWQGGGYAWKSLMLGERSISAWAPPVYPVKMAIAIGALLMLLQGFVMFARNIAVIRRAEHEH